MHEIHAHAHLKYGFLNCSNTGMAYFCYSGEWARNFQFKPSKWWNNVGVQTFCDSIRARCASIWHGHSGFTLRRDGHYQSGTWYIFYILCVERTDNPFVGPSEMTFGLTNGGKVLKVIPHTVISANQKADVFVSLFLFQSFKDSFVSSCQWTWQNELCAHAILNEACFLEFVRAYDVISSALSIR